VKVRKHKLLVKQYLDFPLPPTAANCGEQTVALYLNMTVLGF
jgi:hypothetical protein